MEQDVQKLWDEFWKPIVCNEDGSLNVEQVKKELADFSFVMNQVPKVYCHITGDRMSKVNYHADDVIREADDYQQAQFDQSKKDEDEEKEPPPEQPAGVLQWVKASERLPEDWQVVVIRRISNRLDIVTDIDDILEDCIIPSNQWGERIPFSDLEWLEENPSTSSKEDWEHQYHKLFALYQPLRERADEEGSKEREQAIGFAEWLAENTEIIRSDKITLYRYCDKMNEWGNYTLEDIHAVYKDL